MQEKWKSKTHISGYDVTALPHQFPRRPESENQADVTVSGQTEGRLQNKSFLSKLNITHKHATSLPVGETGASPLICGEKGSFYSEGKLLF